VSSSDLSSQQVSLLDSVARQVDICSTLLAGEFLSFGRRQRNGVSKPDDSILRRGGLTVSVTIWDPAAKQSGNEPRRQGTFFNLVFEVVGNAKGGAWARAERFVQKGGRLEPVAWGFSDIESVHNLTGIVLELLKGQIEEACKGRKTPPAAGEIDVRVLPDQEALSNVRGIFKKGELVDVEALPDRDFVPERGEARPREVDL
jgi:hypothetical protein